MGAHKMFESLRLDVGIADRREIFGGFAQPSLATLDIAIANLGAHQPDERAHFFDLLACAMDRFEFVLARFLQGGSNANFRQARHRFANAFFAFEPEGHDVITRGAPYPTVEWTVT